MDQRNDASERMQESVRHALRLVGPGEPGLEHIAEDDVPESPAAA